MHLEDLDLYHCNRVGKHERGPEKWFRIKLYSDGELLNLGYSLRDDGDELPEFLRMNSADAKELASMLVATADLLDSDNAGWKAREAEADEVDKVRRRLGAPNG